MVFYNKGLELEPENEVIMNNKGIAFLEINQKEAENYFKKALEIKPDYATARKNLALLYNKAKDYSKSVKHFQILADNFPDNPSYNYDLAVNLGDKFYYETRSLEDLEKAIKYFKRAEELSPGFLKAEENIKVLKEIKELYNN
ncbi:tetratricopeptide repeat protein [Candidatus Woesearchaeota archaeon]|nr:tetratricopeptide repeat protein [Candidatus Woesearchaeota archaeon]